MSTGKILLIIYLVCVVIWILLYLIRKNHVKHSTKKDLVVVFTLLSILLAPLVLVIGLISIVKDKHNQNRPRPVPKNIRGYLKKDTVMFNGRTMSLSEVNRITGKEYTLDQIYGKERK